MKFKIQHVLTFKKLFNTILNFKKAMYSIIMYFLYFYNNRIKNILT